MSEHTEGCFNGIIKGLGCSCGFSEISHPIEQKLTQAREEIEQLKGQAIWVAKNINETYKAWGLKETVEYDSLSFSVELLLRKFQKTIDENEGLESHNRQLVESLEHITECLRHPTTDRAEHFKRVARQALQPPCAQLAQAENEVLKAAVEVALSYDFSIDHDGFWQPELLNRGTDEQKGKILCSLIKLFNTVEVYKKLKGGQ